HLYVALQAGIHSDSSMPRESKNPRSHGVEPSPTPMIPTIGDSTNCTCTPRAINGARIIAVIHPAVPPPTITILRSDAGKRPRASWRVSVWLKTVAVGPAVAVNGSL